VAWAAFVEAMLLLKPYASFFGLKVNRLEGNAISTLGAMPEPS